MSPTVTQEPGRLVLFYTALGVENHACFPLPPAGRWGIPLPQDRCLYGTLGRAVALMEGSLTPVGGHTLRTVN